MVQAAGNYLPREVKLMEEIMDPGNNPKVSCGLADQDDMTYTDWIGSLDFTGENE